MTKHTRSGGYARTPAKIAAARANGRRGGRPRRQFRDLAPDSFETGIARHLALAFVAYMGFTTFQTAEKRHGHELPSAYWMNLGKQVSDDYRAGRFGPGSNR